MEEVYFPLIQSDSEPLCSTANWIFHLLPPTLYYFNIRANEGEYSMFYQQIKEASPKQEEIRRSKLE